MLLKIITFREEKLHRLLILFVAFTVVLLWFFSSFELGEFGDLGEFGSVEEANATGGAFRFTKHGGDTTIDDGDWCPLPPCGVDRQISGTGVHYGVGEAGIWQKGECMHCHEPHASFGGVEPPPNTGADSGPDAYLLFKDYGTGNNYSNLCWSCHNNMILGSPPVFGEDGYGYWGYYQGQTNFENSGHGSNPNFIYPGPQSGDTAEEAPNGAPYPRRDRNPLATGNQSSCLNCHSPHGVGPGSYPADAVAPGTGNFGVATAAQITQAVTDGNLTNGVIPRKAIAWEEALCLRCHNSGSGVTGAPDIKTQVDYFIAGGSGHPVRSGELFGRHNLANESQNSLPATGWFVENTFHAECTDCHNPHRVANTNGVNGTVFQPSGVTSFTTPDRYPTAGVSGSGPVKLGSVNQGVWGVSINLSTFEVSVPIRNLTTDDKVYNLCMKCHSAWAWDKTKGLAAPIITATPMYAPSTDGRTFVNARVPQNMPLTDVLAEFDNGNRAYHPVFDVGKNRPERGPLGDGANPVRNDAWCAEGTSDVYTADNTCWPATGVREDLINKAELVTEAGGGSVMVYFEQTLSQTFVPPWLHTSYITCVDCHEDSDEAGARGPHGSRRPFILRTADTNISFTICSSDSSANDASCNTTTTVNYSSIPASEQTTFCFNCHRWDVYHGNVGASPANPDLGRQPHPLRADKSDSGMVNSIYTDGAPTRGISCMGCHGGGCGVDGGGTNVPATDCVLDAGTTAGAKLGNIHGSNYDTGKDAGSNRLIAPGGNWNSFTRGVNGTNGTCNPSDGGYGGATTDAWSGCGNGTRDSTFSFAVTYEY